MQDNTVEVSLKDVESLRLTWGSPCTHPQPEGYGGGTIALPNPLI
jgi:hypothetical protein